VVIRPTRPQPEQHPQFKRFQTAAPNMLMADARQYLGKFFSAATTPLKKVEVPLRRRTRPPGPRQLAMEDTNLLLLDDHQPPRHPLPGNPRAGARGLRRHPSCSSPRPLPGGCLATQVWENPARRITLSVFKGTYSQMHEERERLAGLATQEVSAAARRNRRASQPWPQQPGLQGRTPPLAVCRNWKTPSPPWKPKWPRSAASWKTLRRLRRGAQARPRVPGPAKKRWTARLAEWETMQI